VNPNTPASSLHTVGALSEADLNPNPFRQFAEWFNQALSSNLPEPTAMTLATASKNGVPSARIVLLKGFDDRGFIFYTNYESQKGRELEENPRAALVFYWSALERQIRISGIVTKVSRDESESYFGTRPFGSRCGAWASQQSRVIANREVLDKRAEDLLTQYKDKTVPLPPYWGGYCVSPTEIEFWQGRSSRLHDRFRYTRVAANQWRIERLAP
jgi:pyridoxamine 5'-phosphate oxidase